MTNKKNYIFPKEIRCPFCNAFLILETKERIEGRLSCPECCNTLDHDEIEKPVGARHIYCSVCHSDFLKTKKTCPSCGARNTHFNSPEYGSHSIEKPNNHQEQTVIINDYKEESVTFAVVTLLVYIFLFPLGLVLNLVGLLTGPRRGCFGAMFFTFILLPFILGFILAAMGIPVLEEIMKLIE